jgi:hypothetical protein
MLLIVHFFSYTMYVRSLLVKVSVHESIACLDQVFIFQVTK